MEKPHATMKHLQLRLLVFMLFLSALFTTLSAQPVLSFTNLNSSRGLCSNYVKGLAEDNRGCIWVATEAGLARFDGNSFTTFRQANANICSDELNDVYFYAPAHQLWIASQRDGISVYDVDRQCTVKHYSTENGLMTNDVTKITAAADGGIWITHYHVGVEHFNPKNGKFTHYDANNVKGLANLHSWCSLDDGNGHLLIGHELGGLSVIDLRTKKLQRYVFNPQNALNGGLPGTTVYSLYKDKAGRIWVGTSQGLTLMDLQRGTFRTFRHNAALPGSLLADQVMDIGQRRNGDLWFCTNMGGVSILPATTAPAEGAFINYSPSTTSGSLSSPNAYKFLEDSFGNVWIGTYRNGLDYVSHRSPLFRTLPYMQFSYSALSYKPVWGLGMDLSGCLWLGGENELFGLTQTGVMHTQSIASFAPNTHINSIYRDAQGQLWLSAFRHGVAVFSPTTKTITSLPAPVENFDPYCFYQDGTRMWIGAQQGLFMAEGGQISHVTEIDNQMEDVMVHSIVKDRQGKLWLATFGRGIYVVGTNRKIVAHIENGSGLHSNAVNQLMMDKAGTIWAATRKGLAHFANTANPKSVVVYGSANGLAEEHIHAIAEDTYGYLWLSTNAQISRFNKKTHEFENYSSRYGVPTGDFVNGSVTTGPQGEIFFGSLSGVCCLTPSQFRELPTMAHVCITGLQSYGTRNAEQQDSTTNLPLNQPEVTVPYDQNTIRLTFNVTDVAQNHLTEYDYRVAELGNGQWLSTQGDNHVTFRDLAPGTYNIYVRARMAGQDWDSHMAMLRIVIAPPFWFAWYAKIFYAVLIVLGFWWFMRSYKRKTDLESQLRVEHHRHMNDESLNQERLRFYTNITHELRTPLTLIIGPLDDMANDSNLPQSIQSKLSSIRRSANRLLSLVNELLEFRKTETQNRKLNVIHADLAKEVHETALHFKELNRQSEVEIKTDIEEGDFVQWFDPEIIHIVLDNFMSNAMKYTPKGEVCISLRHEKIAVAPPTDNEDTTGEVMRTVISVSDTGYGIPEEALAKIFQRYYQADGPHQVSGSGIGLALVKSVADLHHAEVKAENRKNGGSMFSFSLLTDETYGRQEEAETEQNEHATDAVTATEQAEAAATEPASEQTNDTRATLLVVEDNDELREYIEESLGEHFRIIQAADGEQGLKLAQSTGPDVIVTDVMMPVMDGFELCRKIKDDINTSHIPVILLTAKDLMEDKAEGYAAGADSYLTKPFSSRLLLSRINNLLRVRRQMAQAIAMHIAVPGSETNEEAKQPKFSPIDQRFLDKLEAFVIEHLDEPGLDVGYIASEMCMSHSTLYRKIKSLIGITVNEYIRRTRLRRAAEMLDEAEYGVSEISDRTGFSTPSYFRQCFKDAYGVTPSDYALGKRTPKADGEEEEEEKGE